MTGNNTHAQLLESLTEKLRSSGCGVERLTKIDVRTEPTIETHVGKEVIRIGLSEPIVETAVTVLQSPEACRADVHNVVVPTRRHAVQLFEALHDSEVLTTTRVHIRYNVAGNLILYQPLYWSDYAVVERYEKAVEQFYDVQFRDGSEAATDFEDFYESFTTWYQNHIGGEPPNRVWTDRALAANGIELNSTVEGTTIDQRGS